MLPDFNRLKVFYFVYRHQSTVQAAKLLHLTQSGISQHLKKLEGELGTSLFTRMHKKLVPTQAGEALYQSVAPFVEGLEETLESLHVAQDQPHGLLRIGAPVEFGQRYLPRWCATFRAEFTTVRFHIELGHPSVLLRQLKQGSLDVAFVDVFSHTPTLEYERSLLSIEPVFAEDLLLVGVPQLLTHSKKKKWTLQELTAFPYVAYSPEAPSLHSWFLHHWQAIPKKLSIALTVESVQASLAAVTEGMGLGVLPSHTLQDELDQGKLIAVQTKREPQVNHISLAQLLDKKPTLTEKSFLSHCKNKLREESLA